ncbi:exopolysaccharide biosynthesis polyprenyl glycosylphosphotransferase [Streptomyces ziwulingensis]
MTAESTVPNPARQPHSLGRPPVSVLPPRAAAGPPFPTGPAAVRSDSALPLLVADGAAALPAALALPAVPHRPLFAALLMAVSLLLAPRHVRWMPTVLEELPAVCSRIAVAWLALAALAAACDPRYVLPASTLLAGFALQAAVGCAGRGTVHWRRRAALVSRPHSALVVGPSSTARRVAAAVLRHPRCGLRPVGIVADDTDGTEPLPVLTTDVEVRRAVVQNGVRDVLAVHPSVRERHAPLLRALAESGCAVWEMDVDSPSWPGRHPDRDRFAGFYGRRLAPGASRPGAGKRVLDVVVSGMLLLLFSPLLLACGVALRVSDGPGIVFRQERIGEGGRPFTMLKFRTHRPADAHESATRWSVADERRMTWLCRLLRRTSLDELPQLWNVFRGDMSLVGPRPERPYFVAKFTQVHPGYAARHRVPAGVTGLAQIHGLRGDTSIEDRARFDNVYIDTWSLWQDVCILLRTAATLVRPTGS